MESSKNIRHEIHENDGSLRQQPISQVYDLDRDGWCRTRSPPAAEKQPVSTARTKQLISNNRSITPLFMRISHEIYSEFVHAASCPEAAVVEITMGIQMSQSQLTLDSYGVVRLFSEWLSLLNSSREKLQAVEIDFGIDLEFALVEGYSGYSQLRL